MKTQPKHGLIAPLSIVMSVIAANLWAQVTVKPTAPAQVNANDIFVAEVTVTAISKLDTAFFVVSFDPAVLQYQNVSVEGTFVQGASLTLNPGAGHVRVVLNMPRVEGVNGTGTIAKVTFKAVGAAGTFSLITLSDVLLGDGNAKEIPSTVGPPARVDIKSVPPPSLTIADTTISEGNTGTVNAVVTVTLVPVAAQVVTVQYATADGTAQAGTDYVAGSGTLTFNPGETTKTITVVINGDTVNEPDETILVNLSNATNATLGDSQGQITIKNDAPAVAVTVSLNGPAKVTRGQVFEVEVVVSTIANLDTASFVVAYTPASGVVEFQGASVDKLLTQGASLTSNPTEGSVRVVINLPGTVGVSGSGAITKLAFKAIGAPGSSAQLTLTEVLLGDVTGREIPSTIGPRVSISIDGTDGTPLIVINGKVSNPDGTPVKDGLRVEVKNTTRNLVRETEVRGGSYQVIFFDPLGVVAAVDDEFRVRVFDGKVLRGEAAYIVEEKDISAFMATIDITLSPPETTVDLSLHAGVNLIHVPVKVATLKRASDLFNALGGSQDVSVLVMADPQGKFIAFTPTVPPASRADLPLSDQSSAIVVMKKDKQVRFTGGQLSETVTLNNGLNLIGVPRSGAVAKMSDLAKKSAAITLVIRESGGKFIAYPPVDADIMAGQGLIVVAKEAATLTLAGGPWSSPLTPAVPIVAFTVNAGSTPVFVVEGVLAREDNALAINGLEVEIANLRTGVTFRDVAGSVAGNGRYMATYVNLASGDNDLRIGDTLELRVNDPSGTFGGARPVRHVLTAEDIRSGRIPEKSALLPNFPNPFNPETWIPYQLAEPADVVIRIFDLHGRLIRTLEIGYQAAGLYTTRQRAAYWNGKNEQGESVASGVYVVQLFAGKYSFISRITLSK